MDETLRNLIAVFALIAGGICLLLLRRRLWQKRLRQSRLDRMVFKPPVTCRELRREHPADANYQLASVTIGFGMLGRENPMEEEVEIESLDFERTGANYTLALGQIDILLRAIRQKGLGRLWKEGQDRAFWHTIESQVGAAITQHEASMAQFAATKKTGE